MKKLFLILILLSFSCKSAKTSQEEVSPKYELGTDITARVSKIDSIANYYLIYIIKNDDYFKIVSDKNQTKPYNGIKVKVGGNYNFKIQQVTHRKRNATENNGIIPIPINYLDITQCWNFNKTEICTESSFELATANNLKGLYLIKK